MKMPRNILKNKILLRYFSNSLVNYRTTKKYGDQCSAVTGKHTGSGCGMNTKPIPELIKYDYIGPPDKISNLRQVILCKNNKNESHLERKLREKRLDTEYFNTEFWTKHNQTFYDEKKKFIAENQKNSDDIVSSDKMSEFYKYFLDKNWKSHFTYNIMWYRKNLEIILLSLQLYLYKKCTRK